MVGHDGRVNESVLFTSAEAAMESAVVARSLWPLPHGTAVESG